jgi:HPt (histidine-containing phosphotransfer) domain-containing protein
MPIMSGYEATELIRGYDKDIPIIALSAAAMIEDKEKAFNAGMNDHLSKPIETDRLYQTIAKWTSSSFTPADELPKQKTEPIVLDLDHLFGLLGENQDVIRNLLANFVLKLQNDYLNLSMLLKNGDSSLGASLHSLKGVSGNMGATRLYTLCIEIEKKYKEGKKEMSKEADELDLEIKELVSFINAYILEHPSKEAMPITDEAAIKKLFDETLEKLKKSILIPHEDQDMLISSLKGKVDALELEKFKESLNEYELQGALEIMQKWKL